MGIVLDAHASLRAGRCAWWPARLTTTRHPADGDRLHGRSIAYLPDYLVQRRRHRQPSRASTAAKAETRPRSTPRVPPHRWPRDRAARPRSRSGQTQRASPTPEARNEARRGRDLTTRRQHDRRRACSRKLLLGAGRRFDLSPPAWLPAPGRPPAGRRARSSNGQTEECRALLAASDDGDRRRNRGGSPRGAANPAGVEHEAGRPARTCSKRGPGAIALSPPRHGCAAHHRHRNGHQLVARGEASRRCMASPPAPEVRRAGRVYGRCSLPRGRVRRGAHGAAARRPGSPGTRARPTRRASRSAHEARATTCAGGGRLSTRCSASPLLTPAEKRATWRRITARRARHGASTGYAERARLASGSDHARCLMPARQAEH